MVFSRRMHASRTTVGRRSGRRVAAMNSLRCSSRTFLRDDRPLRACPRPYPLTQARPKQGPFPWTAFGSPSSPVLRAPRNPFRHHAISPSAHKRGQCPLWAAGEGLSSPCRAVDACPPPDPGRVLHPSGFDGRSLLPSPRHDRLGLAALSAINLTGLQGSRFRIGPATLLPSESRGTEGS